MYKIFGFLKSTAHFLKILTIFSFLMLTLHWIQNLTHATWEWTNFSKPFLNTLLAIGQCIAPGSYDLLGAVFEFKYLVACLIIIGLYYVAHLIYIGFEILEEGYNKGKDIVKKIEENNLNNMLKTTTTIEQKAIQIYQIYVNATIKKKFSHKEININLKEQLESMNDFITKKTGIKAESFENGFLYTFQPFDKIDKVLEVFFKLLKAQTPLDYIICVNIIESSNDKTLFKKLIKLNIENKISMLSNTAYRYRFNTSHRYGTSQLGLYQKDNSTFEVHEFIEI